MPAERRPRRVVVVDADDPMIEVQGSFFWREDHEALIAKARDDGYQAGLREGLRQGSRTCQTSVTLRHRESIRRRVRRLLGFVLFLALFSIVIATIVGQLLRAA